MIIRTLIASSIGLSSALGMVCLQTTEPTTQEETVIRDSVQEETAPVVDTFEAPARAVAPSSVPNPRPSQFGTTIPPGVAASAPAQSRTGVVTTTTQGGPAIHSHQVIRHGQAVQAQAPAANYGAIYGQQANGYSIAYSANGYTNVSPELLKQDVDCEQESMRLMQEYAKESDDAKREELKVRLNEVVGKHFDLKQKIREEEIAALQKKIDDLKSKLDGRTKAKESIVERRVNSLIGAPDPYEWNGQTGPAGSRYNGGYADPYGANPAFPGNQHGSWLVPSPTIADPLRSPALVLPAAPSAPDTTPAPASTALPATTGLPQ